MYFPGFSGGWKIHKEDFFKNVKNVSFLKLRGGYGELGNSEPAGDFAYNGTTSINSANVIFGPDGTVDQISGSLLIFFQIPI